MAMGVAVWPNLFPGEWDVRRGNFVGVAVGGGCCAAWRTRAAGCTSDIACVVAASDLVRKHYLRKGWVEVEGEEEESDSPPAPTHKSCPFCAEPIRAEAIKCKHCGSELPSGGPAVFRTGRTTVYSGDRDR